MLSFFRKIRKNLMNEGKTSRYIKYALGEILLVVIGILIALQINNWNESNKARVYELKMLKEIQVTLKQDLAYMNMILTRVQTIDESSQAVLVMLKQDDVNKTELIKRINDMSIGIVLQFNFGAYEALKSTGIERVLNDELRNELVDYYEFKIPRFTKLLSNSDNPLLRQQQQDLLWELFDFEVSDYQYQEGELISSINKFKGENYNDQLLQKFLSITVLHAKNSIFRLGFLVDDLQDLMELLERELDELDV
jgi:hypothetical protein